jgi:hypothetical protein
VRIRIALGTAMAVIVVPAVLFALFSSTTAASVGVTRPGAVSQHRTVRINDELMSYAQARKVAQLATFYNAVTAQQQATYIKDVTFFKDVAYIEAVAQQEQQQAAARAAAAQAAEAAAAAATAAHAQTTAPAPVAAPALAPAAGSDATSTNTADWACIREHESGDNYAEGNGGAYQFELGTWQALTGSSSPAEDYPASVQDAAALQLFAQRGWGPWTTRYACGL